MRRVRGFILQANYRVISQPGGRRSPVIHLYGRLQSGETFLVREHRRRPHFYIRTMDEPAARHCGAPPGIGTDKRNFAGAPLSRIELQTPQDIPPLRDRLQASGVATFQADVRFAVGYLIELGIRGGCEIQGEALPGMMAASLADETAGVHAAAGKVHGRADASAAVPSRRCIDWIFDDPILRPAEVQIEPRVLSFDIETSARGERLLAISLYGADIDEVLIVDSSARRMPAAAVRCVNEYAALDAFCARVGQVDPDVLTGWNIIDFDLTVLQRLAARLHHPFALGRDGGALRIHQAQGYFGSGQASVPGRLVLDGIDLLRSAFVRMDDYSLDAVAREVLGEGKALRGDARERIAEILHNYRHDLPAFALYARTDARLAYQIVQRLNVIALAFARSRLTGMTPDRVAASIASFDFLYMAELERLDIVAPSVRSGQLRRDTSGRGGHVLEPVPGLHRNVWVFDFISLYPSIIRTFNIDPLSFVTALEDAGAAPGGACESGLAAASADRSGAGGHELIHTGGAAFRREPAILPRLLDELFAQREAAKLGGDKVAANAIKILMNSFYGVLGTPACRFFNRAIANAITGTGREVLQWSQRWFEAAGYRVLYGDTDSLFVVSGLEDAAAAAAAGRELADRLSAQLARHVQARCAVHSRLMLKFEKLYLQLFLPRARHSTRGASKRYVGLRHLPEVMDAEPPAVQRTAAASLDRQMKAAVPQDPAAGSSADLEFVGMEVVRRDWTALARQVQRELYHRLFTGQAVDAYLAEVIGQVRRGALDDALVYRKNLRKEAQAYTATTPPHVVAARKSTQPSGRLVSYVMTSAGAEPLDNVQHPLDREHYVHKQIRPVAEPVLAALGFDFEQVIGDQRQLDLLSMFEDN